MSNTLPVKLAAELETLPEKMTQAQWLKRGRVMAAVHDASQWALGDWWIYGERRFGEGATAAARIGIPQETLRRYGRVAARFEPDRRRPDVSWSHHDTVMALDADRADELLSLAASNDWTREELRTAVQTVQLPSGGPATPASKSGAAPGLTAPEQGVREEEPADPPPVIDAPSRPHPEPARPDDVVPRAKTLAVELASVPPMGWLSVPTDQLRSLGAVIDAQLTERGVFRLDSDTQRLVAAVAAWASEGNVSFHDAVDRVIDRLTQVSTPRKAPSVPRTVEPRLKGTAAGGKQR